MNTQANYERSWTQQAKAEAKELYTEIMERDLYGCPDSVALHALTDKAELAAEMKFNRLTLQYAPGEKATELKHLRNWLIQRRPHYERVFLASHPTAAFTEAINRHLRRHEPTPEELSALDFMAALEMANPNGTAVADQDERAKGPDPEEERKRQRLYADLQARSDRHLGRNPAEAQKLEDMIRDARTRALSFLDEAHSSHDQLVITRKMDERYNFGTEFGLKLNALHAALWTEGYPSPGDPWLEERVNGHADSEAPAASGSSQNADHDLFSSVLKKAENACPASTPAAACGSQNAHQELAARRQTFLKPLLESKRSKGRKWTRNALAEKSGVGKTTIQGYWDGTRRMSKENRRAVAEALEIDVKSLPD